MVATPPRSHQLAAGSTSTSSSWEPIYTCPVGKVVIVKVASLHSYSGLNITVYLGVRTGGVDYALLVKDDVGHLQELPLVIDHVLEEGDILEAYVPAFDSGNRLEWVVSGSVLSNS